MSPNGLAQFLMGIPWFAWIAIVAIVCGSISRIVAQHHSHLERLEMIRHGINPDGAASGKPGNWPDAEV